MSLLNQNKKKSFVFDYRKGVEILKKYQQMEKFDAWISERDSTKAIKKSKITRKYNDRGCQQEWNINVLIRKLFWKGY